MLGITASELQGLPGQFSPWFDLCHYTLAALAVRKDVGVSRARANPLATWLATMSASFAGSLLANPLLGKPILAAVSNEYQVMLASLIWWSVFFSPGDIFYSLTKHKFLYIPICVVKEIYRGKKVLGGMKAAQDIFPHNELLIVAIGVLKGNGSGFMKPITRLISGEWSPGRSELLQMSVTTKECLVAAVLLLSSSAGLLPALVSGDLLYLGIILTFITVKLSSVLAEPIDPFKPLESLSAWLCLGGLWENIQDSEAKQE